MPIYEYECPVCGHFEVVQKVDAKPLKCKPDCDNKKCPKTAERVMSASAFHLKGSGWYKTDYSGGSAKSGKSKDSASASGAGSSGTGDSAGSTPETKTDTAKKETKPKGGCGPGCGCH